MNTPTSTKLQELFLQINITSGCNLACTHCYVDDDLDDMDVDLFSEVIRQFQALRERLAVKRAWVQISGGEPLVHPRLSEILKICSNVFGTKVLTNGTLIDNESAHMISKYCESAQVSFDGDREMHDSRRGAGSFDAALQGLRLLKSKGLPVSARITVGDDNCTSVEPLFELLNDDIDAFHISRVVPFGGCGIKLPDTQAYRKVIYRLFAKHRYNPRVRFSDPFFGPLINSCAEQTEFYGCSAGISGLCVDQTGDIYPCRRLPINLGNTKEVSLESIYYNHPLMKQLQARELKGRCGECEDIKSCGGSRCIAYALTGDPFAADPGCIYAE